MTLHSSAIHSKARALISNTLIRLRQIEGSKFPTRPSGLARELLENTLKFLINHDEHIWLTASPPVVYQAVLLDFQCLAKYIERSSTDSIPWPLVGFFDQLWSGLFGHDGPQVFYSICENYNYHLLNYSSRISYILKNVLDEKRRNSINIDLPLYMVSLTSVEEDNIPLYVNLLHEFGHALYKHIEKDNRVVHETLVDHMKKAVPYIKEDPLQSLVQKTVYTFAEELFADLVALCLAGPVFFLSLYELSWGSSSAPDGWLVGSSGAHPSYAYRFDLLKKNIEASPFFKGESTSPTLQSYVQVLLDIETNHQGDKVYGQCNPDLKNVLCEHLSHIKKGLKEFIEEARVLLNRTYSETFYNPKACDIENLIDRLKHGIVPNAIPNGTLEQPADFRSILNASALRRLSLLSKDDTTPEMLDELRSLTEKAFEMSLVQQQYNNSFRQ